MLVSFSAWISRVVTAFCSILSVRFLMDELGVEGFAAYSLIIGLIGWYGLLDLGTPTSAQNYISESRAKNVPYQIYVTALFIVMGSIAIVAVIALFFIGPLMAHVLLIKFTFLSDIQKNQSFISLGICSIFLTMGAVVYRVWYAEQIGYFVHLLQSVSMVISVAIIYWVMHSNVSDKYVWAIIGSQAPMAVLPVVAWINCVQRRWEFDYVLIKQAIKLIFLRAWRLWFFNIAAVVVLQLDLIVLSQFVDAKQLAMYALCSKLFLTVGLLYGVVLQAYWPVCTELCAKNKWDEIYKFIRRYLISSFALIIVATLVIIALREEIVMFFSPNQPFELPIWLIVIFGVSYLIRAWTDIFAVILQSMSQMNMLLVMAVAQAVFNVSIQLMLVPIIGVYGALIGVTLSFLLTVSWGLPRKVIFFSKQGVKVQ